MRKTTVEKYYSNVYYLIRDFDLFPEELSRCRYLYHVKREYVDECLKKGLMFRNREEAMKVHDRLMNVINEMKH